MLSIVQHDVLVMDGHTAQGQLLHLRFAGAVCPHLLTLRCSAWFRILLPRIMHIHARIRSTAGHLATEVQTNTTVQGLPLPPKPTGQGSAVNGGELLLLALATCYCNDLYREAARRGITLTSVVVECSAEFGAEGQPGANFSYRAQVQADVPAAAIEALLAHTDQVAEVHNTLRRGVVITRLP